MNKSITQHVLVVRNFLCAVYILSNKRNAQNRKLNEKFSSTVKVFMNIDVRYKYDKMFESTIKLPDY